MSAAALLLTCVLWGSGCDTSQSSDGPSGSSTSTTASSGSGTGGGQAGSGGDGGSGGSGGSDGGAGQGGGGGTAQPIAVLFVGNSYTFANDLPGLVASIDPGGPVITVASVTVGGATLGDHLITTGAKEQIESGAFTHVVLQGQSVEPLYAPGGFFAAAGGLSIFINDASAQPVFFETWARAEGHAVYQEVWSGGTPTAMQAGLRAAYQQAATDSGGVMAPVGDAWEISLAQNPNLVLHTADGSHPTLTGSYLAAAVFNLVLTERSDFAAPAPAPIPEADAATLRDIASGVVTQR